MTGYDEPHVWCEELIVLDYDEPHVWSGVLIVLGW